MSRITTHASTHIPLAVLTMLLLVGCGADPTEQFETEVVGEVEQAQFSACDWNNAPTNGTITLGSGPGTHYLQVNWPYGSASCPFQSNVNINNQIQRNYYPGIIVMPGQAPPSESTCNKMKLDLRVARMTCVGINCQWNSNTVKFKGKWQCLDETPCFCNGWDVEQGDVWSLFINNSNALLAKMNARVYNGTTGQNMTISPVGHSVTVTDSQ